MDKKLIEQLEAIFDKDQQSIKLFKSGKISPEELNGIQNENFKFIENFIRENGFPFINISSEKAYRTAFLIIQHSGDLKYMESIIELFKDKNNQQIIKSDLAYLIDRVRILSNRPQLYGTQYKIEDNKITFFEIENPENLEERRGNLGMESFESYKNRIQI